MRQNIGNNKHSRIRGKINNRNRFDYDLGHARDVSRTWDVDDAVDFSNWNIIDGRLVSDVEWVNAVNEGGVMEDIGLTGMDNGFVSGDVRTMTKSELREVVYGTHMDMEEFGTRMFMTPMGSDTGKYVYPMSLYEDTVSGGTRYMSFRGGFFQGFWKLEGFGYQTFPDALTETTVLRFKLRNRPDIADSDKTVNVSHPENRGIFFFIGTRAENKFAPIYNRHGEGCGSGCAQTWIDGLPYGKCSLGGDVEPVTSGGTGGNCVDDGNMPNDYLHTYDYNKSLNLCSDCSESHTAPEHSPYMVHDENGCYQSGTAIDCTYFAPIEKPIVVDGYEPKDSAGDDLDKQGYYETGESDNKFLMFDRTKSGYTVSTWIEGTTVVINGRKANPQPNYFPLLHHGESGLTVHNIEQYVLEHEDDYNIYSDITNNAFALRVTDNGAIGYRYMGLDCNASGSERCPVTEEYSKDGIIPDNEWVDVTVRIEPSPSIPYDEWHCTKRKGLKMKIFVFVNGFLKLVTKELDALSFKALNDVYRRQEGVPYSMSIGGGSIGLADPVYDDPCPPDTSGLPIEENFCGTFIGDMSDFSVSIGCGSF